MCRLRESVVPSRSKAVPKSVSLRTPSTEIRTLAGLLVQLINNSGIIVIMLSSRTQLASKISVDNLVRMHEVQPL